MEPREARARDRFRMEALRSKERAGDVNAGQRPGVDREGVQPASSREELDLVVGRVTYGEVLSRLGGRPSREGDEEGGAEEWRKPPKAGGHEPPILRERPGTVKAGTRPA